MDGTRELSTPYTAHVLLNNDTPNTPKNDVLVRYLADKYASLRVSGLEQSPQSFSATLQDELRLAVEEKISRILVSKKHILVIVKRALDANMPERLWYDEEWVGQATLFGPLSWEVYSSPFRKTHTHASLSNSQVQLLAGWTDEVPKTDLAKTAYWHMTALYIDVNHRRLGLAKKLCLAAFEHIRNISSLENFDRALLRIIIKPTNTVVVDMYRSLGFSVVDGLFSTLAEATVCAGDHESLPPNYGERKDYTGRGGLFMLKPIDLNMD